MIMPAGSPRSASCERKPEDGMTLATYLDRYLDALVAKDLSRAPIARTAKYTENGQPLEIGDGLWRTASALPSYKLVFVDSEAAQVGLCGLLKENGWPIWMGARLKVLDGQIVEIEALVKRE